jgi:large subunit ribosomal protein L19
VVIGVKIIEGTKERVQFYEGTIIARKIVQLTLLLLSVKCTRNWYRTSFLDSFSKLDSIIVLRSSKVRRAKLYYLRNLRGKASRLKQTFK